MVDEKKRDYGIDFLRILAMLAVVTLHVLNFGGLLNNAVPLTTNYEVAWFLETVCYCAVDVYVLITGYVYAGRKTSGVKLLVLWLTVLFYSVLIPLVLRVMGYSISMGTLVGSLFPIMRRRYWFFNAYFALFLFIPTCNLIVQNKDSLKNTILISFALFSVASTLSVDIDLFLINGGSSFLWFLNLYLCGAYIRLYGLPKWLSVKAASVVFCICVLLMFAFNNLCLLISNRILGKYIRWIFYSYSSPLFYIGAICIVAVFSRIHITSEKTKKVIGLISPLTFGVYLIHENPEFRHFFIIDAFLNYLEIPAWRMLLAVAGTVIVIFAFCCIVDYMRSWLFRKFGVNMVAKKVLDRVTGVHRARLSEVE